MRVLSGLETFAKNAPPEAISTGVVATAQLVFSKAFQERFTKILMGASLNLVRKISLSFN